MKEIKVNKDIMKEKLSYQYLKDLFPKWIPSGNSNRSPTNNHSKKSSKTKRNMEKKSKRINK